MTAIPPINAADLAIFVIIAISGLLAFARGLVREVLSMGAWIGAAVVTYYGFPRARPLTRQFISSESGADLISGVSLFVLSLIILALIGHALASNVRGSALSSVDRSLGFLFGLLRGALLVCLAFLVMNWAYEPSDQPAELRQARTLPLVERGADILKSLVPQDLQPQEESLPSPPSVVRPLDPPDGGASNRSGGLEGAQQQQIERALRELVAPTPRADPTADDAAGGAAAPEDSGYSEVDRRGLDRLIQSNQ